MAARASDPEEPSDPDAQRKSFLLRLPPELFAELRSWANQEVRSLNGHIEFVLREAVRARRGSKRSQRGD